MLRAVTAIAVPLLDFLTVVIVGLRLTAPDFRRALRQLLHLSSFAVFATASFVAQVPLAVAAVAWFRFRTAPAPAAVVEVGHP
jgi:hypothetical protein